MHTLGTWPEYFGLIPDYRPELVRGTQEIQLAGTMHTQPCSDKYVAWHALAEKLELYLLPAYGTSCVLRSVQTPACQNPDTFKPYTEFYRAFFSVHLGNSKLEYSLANLELRALQYPSDPSIALHCSALLSVGKVPPKTGKDYTKPVTEFITTNLWPMIESLAPVFFPQKPAIDIQDAQPCIAFLQHGKPESFGVCYLQLLGLTPEKLGLRDIPPDGFLELDTVFSKKSNA